MHRKAISLRDVLNIIDFFERARGKLGSAVALWNGLCLVIIDGLCLGLDVSEVQKKEIISKCETHFQ